MYNGHMSFDVAFICSTLPHCGVCDLSVRRLKWEVSYAFDAGNDFPANQVTCFSGFGLAERQILFSDVK